MLWNCLLCLAVGLTAASVQAVEKAPCKNSIDSVPYKDWIDIRQNCVNAVRNQIQMEMRASMEYLALGAHFSRDKVNRPGFAKFFFESAGEEREHGRKLISYLLMRGELQTGVTGLIDFSKLMPEKTTWSDGAEALTYALKLEKKVTDNIRSVIAECEQGEFNHYHLVDYLTGEFLEEQYKGQREIAGKISNLVKMSSEHGALGEFLFDKTLLDDA